MANNWPDGGEVSISRTEKLIMGAIGVALVGGLVAAVLLLILRSLGPLSPIVGAAGVVAGLAVGLLWVRPWETEPERR